MMLIKFAYVGEFTRRRRRVGVGELTGYFISCQGHRTIGTEALDPQKSKITHASPVLSETMDGK